jgi:hypothetical protein
MALYATNNHYVLAMARVAEAVCNLSLSIFLAYRVGMIGVALGTAIPSLIFRVLIQPLYVTRILGLSLWSYTTPVVAAAGAALAALVTWNKWLAPANDPASLWACMVAGLQVSALYALWLVAAASWPWRSRLAACRAAPASGSGAGPAPETDTEAVSGPQSCASLGHKGE